MRFLNTISTVVMLSTPLAALALAQPVWADMLSATVSVTGEGHVAVAPDMATIALGVTTEGATAKAAMTTNSDALSAVMTRLKSTGIAERDLQTSGLSLGPRYDYDTSGGSQKVNGYVATNMVTVRVLALDTVGAVLDASITDGANTLNGITFGLQDNQAASDQARKAAVADARRKAELYAETLGAKLGRVVSLSEQGGMVMPMAMGAASFAKDASVPIANGELSVDAGVSIVFELTQ